MSSIDKAQVCIIGGGPAGVICAYLFALRGISVVLLEGKKDFDREFRGDTLHASSLEILEQLGLVDEILAQSNSRIEKLSFSFIDTEITLADFSAMDTKYPYVALIPQEKFLSHIVEKGKQLAGFNILMGAQVRELIEEDGKIIGVKYSYDNSEHELDAELTIGADGRGSSARRLAGINLKKTSPPMDIVWFRLSLPTDTAAHDVNAHIGSGNMIVIINREEYLQVGYIIMKGDYKKLREQGIAHFHEIVKHLAPGIANTITEIKDWSQMAILSVVTGRAEQWYKDGLLLIGDAAHVMSPVGGVGINYAIQDAVAAVNQLARPIKENRLALSDLARVQKRREPAVAMIQRFQSLAQKRVISAALKSDEAFSPPLPMKIISKIPFARKKLAEFLAYGTRHEIVQDI
ncbi:MAG: 2-polyprenyl-6-methoxyphenol hydroxylase-like FAD-dependent oxidoreductase [Planctomycetota bacterium]|jgi:2-polyprenyl-6-methoxyphenol hydroxylase-like FAD-dependent oxidoreductase